MLESPRSGGLNPQTSIDALCEFINQSVERIESGDFGDSEAFLSRYLEHLAETIVKGQRSEMEALVKSCDIARQHTEKLRQHADGIEHTDLSDLFEFPFVLEEFALGACSDVTELEEFLREAGWEAPDVPAVHSDPSRVGNPESRSDYQADTAQTVEEPDTADVDVCRNVVNRSHTEIDDASGPGGISQPLHQLDDMQQDVVDVLRLELAEIIELRHENLAMLTASEPDERAQQLELQVEQIHRIASATDMVGLLGLSQAVMYVAENMRAMDVTTKPLGDEFHSLVLEWPVATLGYLQELFSERATTLLIQFLRRAEWPQPLDEGQLASIEQQLHHADIRLEDAGELGSDAFESIEDLSLEIPADVDRALLDSLLNELPELTAELSRSIQSMLDNRFMSDVDMARRLAHTIKGSCNTVGIRGMANMTHILEDILDATAAKNAIPDGELANAILDASDCLESMVEAVLGLSIPPAEAEQIQQTLLHWIRHIREHGVQEVSVLSAPPGAPSKASQGGIAIAGESPESPTESATDAELRIRSSLVDDMLRLAGESIISSGQVGAHVTQAQDTAAKISSHNHYLSNLVSELEQLVDVRGLTSKQRRADDQQMDELEMERYNELHTSTHRLVEAAMDSLQLTNLLSRDLAALQEVSDTQGKLVRDNQESVLKTRMVPVSTVVPRFQRCVRQAARATGKAARMEVKGAETLIDSTVLNDLVDPIMHILRNAVDHGIELPEDRTALDKDHEGCIQLVVAREGDHISVLVSDDGGGLDTAAILARAEENGLLSEQQGLSAEDINNLILVQGLSTSTEITQMSGRGVGMDIVNEKVRTMKGTLSISSEAGQGTAIAISLPVTLLSTHAMLLPVSSDLYAVSNFGVEEIRYVDQGDVTYLGDKLVMKSGGDFISAHYLNEKLGISREAEAVNDAHVGLIVRTAEGAKNVILAERVIDSRDLVVKPMGEYAPDVDGVVGATILGDGSVAPVIDLTELLLTNKHRRVIEHVPHTDAEGAFDTSLKALIVDDSYSARTTLEQLVGDMGFDVYSAKDGMEAVEILQETPPNILITDLEMPRMNGLDLTAHVRSNDKLQMLPIIMVTSRSTQKHRELASSAGVNEYITKPYNEDELLEMVEALVS